MTLFVRTRYQYGSLRLRKRERGPDVWEFRYYETDSQGQRKRQSVILGDRALYSTETQARKATQALLLRLNGEAPRTEMQAASFAALLDRYIEQELPERYSTRKSHLSNIRVHIRPRWSDYPLDKMKPMAMEQWLRELPLAQPVAQAKRADRGGEVEVAVAGVADRHQLGHSSNRGDLGLILVEGRVTTATLVIGCAKLDEQAVIATNDFP